MRDLLAAAATLCLASCASQPTILAPPTVEVWQVGGAMGCGSGWALSPDTLVTAAHVVTDEPIVRFRCDDAHDWCVADGCTAWPDIDGATVAIPDWQPLLPLPICRTLPQVGEEVWCVGYIFCAEVVYTRGPVLHVGDAGFLIDASVAQGMSGGPVLNDRGEVLGILSRHTNLGRPLAVAVPIARILEAMR